MREAKNMFLKKLKLINYRKFGENKNVVEFVSSEIIKKEDLAIDEVEENGTIKESIQTEEQSPDVDIASDTTLIIGKNNAGKTTIITALDCLINHKGTFGINDFNYRYLQKYFNEFDIDNPPEILPHISFVLTIALEEESDDRISNLIPFMLVEDVNDSELDICIRYEIKDAVSFQSDMNKLMQEKTNKNKFLKFIKLKINADFKLGNLMELRCIKANHLKNENCLSDEFSKIINYRYETLFKSEKQGISESLEDINDTLTSNISKNHTEVIKNVLKKLVSMERMGVQLSANITFDKLMRDLIKYEYIEDDANIPENQFGLGYTNLVMIIAAIMDYMERYPESSFNSKINLISIEEPETFMHPQMQELFIKNINEAMKILLSSKNKNVNSQIIVSTHSSHILNSKIQSTNTFNNICYLHEENHNAVVANLCNEKVMPKENMDENSAEFKFLKKHIKYKVTELFFSEAAIFVEGFAEDIVLPYYIEKRKKLNTHYISIFNINGAHGFLYKHLIQVLGIPVLIITDLDIKREENKEDLADEGKESAVNFSQIDSLNKRETTNATIKDFHGKADLSDIPSFYKNENIYLAYQGKINQYYATSFEEAFILTNYDNKVVNDILKTLKPKIYKDITDDGTDQKKNMENSYKWQVKLENSKGEFASRLLYEIVNSETDDIPKLPDYIVDGLDWIEEKLGGK